MSSITIYCFWLIFVWKLPFVMNSFTAPCSTTVHHSAWWKLLLPSESCRGSTGASDGSMPRQPKPLLTSAGTGARLGQGVLPGGRPGVRRKRCWLRRGSWGGTGADWRHACRSWRSTTSSWSLSSSGSGHCCSRWASGGLSQGGNRMQKMNSFLTKNCIGKND